MDDAVNNALSCFGRMSDGWVVILVWQLCPSEMMLNDLPVLDNDHKKNDVHPLRQTSQTCALGGLIKCYSSGNFAFRGQGA